METRIDGSKYLEEHVLFPTALDTQFLTKAGVQFLYNTPLLGFLAHEARQRCKLWKNARGVVANVWNEEDNIIQCLSAFPELQITD